MTLDYNRSLVADKKLLELGLVVDIVESFRGRFTAIVLFDRYRSIQPSSRIVGHWAGDVTKLRRRIYLRPVVLYKLTVRQNKKVLTRRY